MLHPFKGREQKPDLAVHFLRIGYRGCDFLPQQFRIPPPQAMHRRADRGVAHIQLYGNPTGKAPAWTPVKKRLSKSDLSAWAPPGVFFPWRPSTRSSSAIAH